LKKKKEEDENKKRQEEEKKDNEKKRYSTLRNVLMDGGYLMATKTCPLPKPTLLAMREFSVINNFIGFKKTWNHETTIDFVLNKINANLAQKWKKKMKKL